MAQWFDVNSALIIVGVAAVAWFFYARWKTQEKLKRLAFEMGLTFSTGADELTGSVEMSGQQEFDASPVKKALRLFSAWRLSGKMNGVTVKARQVVEQTRNRSEKSVYLEAFFDTPKSFGMHIMRKPKSSLLLTTLSRLRPDGLSEIRTGNEAIDQSLMIKGNDVEGIRSFLNDASVQNQLLRAIETDRGITISDEGARLVRGASFSDPDQIRSTLSLLSEIVRGLQSAS